MALDWLIGNDSPQFWKNYLSHFNIDKDRTKRYVVFDFETTGTNWKEDSIISINAIGIIDDAIIINDFLEVYIKQQSENDSETDNLNKEKVVEAEAVIQLLNFIKNSTLVSHNTNLDIELINQSLKRLGLGKLKNPVIDTNVLYHRWKGITEESHTTLQEISRALKINEDYITATDCNIYTNALIFIKLKKLLKVS